MFLSRKEDPGVGSADGKTVIATAEPIVPLLPVTSTLPMLIHTPVFAMDSLWSSRAPGKPSKKSQPVFRGGGLFLSYAE